MGSPENPRVLECRNIFNRLVLSKQVNLEDWIKVGVMLNELVEVYEELERIGDRVEI